MYPSTKTQFFWVGQFISFVPGRKSPYQHLMMQVLAADDLGLLLGQQQVKLGSDLRRMMMDYLQPQDWIRVAGKAKLDGHTGEPLWKAGEIVKVSAQQAGDLIRDAYAQRAARQAVVSSTVVRSTVESCKPTRILICQKSSCRQRGSQTVGDAIALALKSTDQAARIQIQPTGCMKQCKTGPHLVLMPAKQPQQKATVIKYTRVTPDAATKIIRAIL